MGRRGRMEALILAAVAAVATAAFCAPASAGTGALNLRYTSTTTSFSNSPGRTVQETYQPCSGGERLIGIGGWAQESIFPPPYASQFKLGKIYFTTIRPTNYNVGVPDPDANHEVADVLLKNTDDLSLGEDTICASSAGNPVYPTEKKKTPKKSRTGITAKCPDGTELLSGGGSASGPFKSQRLVATVPIDDGDPDSAPDDAWRVTVDNMSKHAHTAKAYAICSATVGAFYANDFLDLPPRDRGHAEADCPPGQYAISGGVGTILPYGKAKLVASRYPPVAGPDSWIAEVDNISHQEDMSGTVYAMCHT